MKIRKLNNGVILSIICIMLSALISFPSVSQAVTESIPKALLIYSVKSGELDENVRDLDMLIGHFTTDITIVNSEEVRESDLKDVTHIFYFGQAAEKASTSFHKLFDDYTGYFVAFGYNSEHLGNHFSFINPLHEVIVDQLYDEKNKTTKLEITPEYMNQVELQGKNDVLLWGTLENENKAYPIAVKNGKNLYIAVDNFSAPKYVLIGEVLHGVFENEHEAAHPAYMRLEDIHPLVDPQKVKEITEILHTKKIPFMMAVIPVYTNPETGKKHHFSDSPKLLKVLKDAQKKGGSIVLHGYTHQFRDSETGEGFEFWDVNNNTPIYAGAHEEFTLKKQSDFNTIIDYENYMEELMAYEREYIQTKITRGIQELTNYGLYPLAFEAPHYTMSQNGYKVVSEHFSTYVGQVQLSDADWEIMGSSPYITTPSFLHGMQLLPETMSYVLPEDPQSVEKMMASASDYQHTKDGILAAFYHPYLGVERFEELILKMEKLKGISWIDLKQMEVWVKADNIEISTVKGEITANVKRSGLLLTSIDFPAYHFQRLTDLVVWMMAIIGGLAVLTFIGFTLFMSSRTLKMGG